MIPQVHPLAPPPAQELLPPASTASNPTARMAVPSAVDFWAVLLFLALYYLRPQEWIPGVSLLRPVTLTMAIAIFATIGRSGGFSWREVFKTPHDYLMAAYFLWIVCTAQSAIGTLGEVYNLYVFYLVTVLGLSTLGRIRIYLTCWTWLILAVAALAVASEYGFDPTGSYDLTHGKMKDRLSLNISIFENPNVLGHSVAPAVMLLFYLLIWNRPIFSGTSIFPLFALPLYCVYLTQSKGAYLAGFAIAVASFCFGRSKLAQIWILAGALTLGWAAINQLPRMEELSQGKREAGIRGRVIAFKFGYDAVWNHTTGIGYGKFVSGVSRAYRYPITPHSSYVHVGAIAGLPGLFLFSGILYCCLRSLVQAKTSTSQEERARRMLFTLLLSFLISSWMIDWAFRGYFFLIVAAIAAFHRHMLTQSIAPKQAAADTPALKALKPASSVALPSPAAKPLGQLWNKLGWIDYGLIVATTGLILYIWKYGMRNI
jgi:O-antigen ligase